MTNPRRLSGEKAQRAQERNTASPFPVLKPTRCGSFHAQEQRGHRPPLTQPVTPVHAGTFRSFAEALTGEARPTSATAFQHLHALHSTPAAAGISSSAQAQDGCIPQTFPPLTPRPSPPQFHSHNQPSAETRSAVTVSCGWLASAYRAAPSRTLFLRAPSLPPHVCSLRAHPS